MSPLTDEQHVRLEVLKIAHRPDKDVDTNLERCKALTEFVMGGKIIPPRNQQKRITSQASKSPAMFDKVEAPAPN